MLFENGDNEYIIDNINLLLSKYSSKNISREEIRSNINYYLVNFQFEFLSDINQKYLPKIEENEKNIVLDKINKVFEYFLNYNINKEDYDIDISFKKSFLEENCNESFYIDINKFYDVNYPSINCLNYKFTEEETIQQLGKKYKFEKKTKSIKLNIISKYFNSINSNNKIDLIKNILNQKIIIYDYPAKKIGIIKGIYYEGKYYSLNDENLDITDKESPSTYKYEKSYLYYEYSGFIIKIKNKIKYTKINENIQILEITKIENGIGELYEYIPIEFTSLNILKENESAHILIDEIDIIKLFYEKYHKK